MKEVDIVAGGETYRLRMFHRRAKKEIPKYWEAVLHLNCQWEKWIVIEWEMPYLEEYKHSNGLGWVCNNIWASKVDEENEGRKQKKKSEKLKLDWK
jgi:hypothetical protein